MNHVKIIIADDHNITRLGLNILCKEVFPNCLINETAVAGNIFYMVKAFQPNLLILDLFIDDTNTLTMIPELLEVKPDLNILVITMASESTFGNRVLLSGAKGFVNKLDDNVTLKTAIIKVASGMRYVNEIMYMNHLFNMNGKKESYNPFTALTNKEMEMVHYFIEGFSASEIGEKARLAVGTVSTYKNRIFGKLEIDNVIDLVNLVDAFKVRKKSS